MTCRCMGCDAHRDRAMAHCPSCEEVTDGYFDDGRYPDSDRDAGAYLARFREPSLRDRINATVAAGEQAKRNAEAKGLDMSSPDFWSSMLADLRPDYLPEKEEAK